jgi:hypothetical protein
VVIFFHFTILGKKLVMELVECNEMRNNKLVLNGYQKGGGGSENN